MTVISKCPKCGSTDFKVVNPDAVRTSREITVMLTCECNNCKTDLLFGRPTRFTIIAATDAGRERGVLY